MSDLPRILVISGPTGSGKSALALKLARNFSGEIINADSVQMYKGFDIGSAKPAASTLEQCRHHLISEIEPNEEFNAGIFCKRADKIIGELSKRATLPIVVGGTGLYIRSLLCGLAEIDSIDDAARSELSDRERAIAGQFDDGDKLRIELFNWLREIDPASAAKLIWKDIARVRRALLVKLSSGKSIAELQSQHRHEDRRYTALVIVLLPERETLYRALNLRVSAMLETGLVQEVEQLRSQYDPQSRPFNAIGYKHVLQFLNGEVDYLQMVTDIQRDTRHYAKRQFTWWANQPQKLAWKRWEFAASGAKIETAVDNFMNSTLANLQTTSQGNSSQVDSSAAGEIFYLPVSGSGC